MEGNDARRVHIGLVQAISGKEGMEVGSDVVDVLGPWYNFSRSSRTDIQEEFGKNSDGEDRVVKEDGRARRRARRWKSRTRGTRKGP